jgi:hypothetical protein
MKKGNAALLVALGGLKKKPGEASSEPDETAEGGDEEDAAPSADEVEQTASDDVFDALKADAREGFRDALRRFVKACMKDDEY